MTTQSAPLLVVLHGHDSSAEAAAQLAAEIDPDGRFHHVTPQGPDATDGGGFEWFSAEPRSLARAQAVVGSLLEELSSAGSVVVVGYSQGGAVALATLTAPDGPTVAAVACVSGYLAEEPGLDHDLARLVATPVLIQHGRHDDVVPDFLAADLVTALESAGVDVTAQWFDMGHERTAESLVALRGWLADRP